MKIAATVILYNPTEVVVSNIKSYIKPIEKLYIVDNSKNSSPKIIESIRCLEKTVYIHDGENKGIAVRLNQICGLAKQDGYEWLLTMDQDSNFEEGTINNYLDCIRTFDPNEKVSMFGINHSEKTNAPNICNPSHVHHLITSGSILSVKLHYKIGGFDENLFIDEVDFEYCLRSISQGFLIIQFANIFLNHNLGETYYHRSLKSAKLTSRVLHSAERIYYMTRNFLYIQSKYKTTFPNEIKARKNILFNRIKNNILYNKQRAKVLKYIAKGVRDYKRKRMGKLI